MRYGDFEFAALVCRGRDAQTERVRLRSLSLKIRGSLEFDVRRQREGKAAPMPCPIAKYLASGTRACRVGLVRYFIRSCSPLRWGARVGKWMTDQEARTVWANGQVAPGKSEQVLAIV